MSASNPTPPTAGAGTVAGAITSAGGPSNAQAVASLVDNLKSAARQGAGGVPDAVHQIAQLDPAYADKSLAASKTAWGSLAVLGLTIVAQKLDLGWGADVINLVAGAGVLIGLRLLTSAKVTSLLPK